jgi:hypothetical protein
MTASPPNPSAPKTDPLHPSHGGQPASSPNGGSRWRVYRVAAAFTIGLIVLSQGIGAPFQKDAEPQSAQWIVSIVRDGNWLLPRDYYSFADRKPPLFYWLSALAAKVSAGNVDEVRARVVSLVAGATLAAIVLDWTCAEIGTFAGWLAFFFLLGSYGFASRATTALTDMLMTLLLFSVYVVILPQLDRAPASRRTIAAGVLAGLALLTKGPVTLLLLALATAVYMLMVRENPLRLLLRGWPWMAATLAVAIAATWYVPAALAGRGALVGVFIDENFGHFMPAAMGGTGEAARPVYYIAIRTLGGALPLTCLLPALALAFLGDTFSAGVRRPLKYQLALALAVLLLFSAASAKRDDYILPALPPLAIMFAALFSDSAADDADNDNRCRRRPYAALVRDATVALVTAVMAVGTVVLLVAAKTRGRLSIFGLALQSSDVSYAAIFISGLAHLSWPFVLFVAATIVGALLACAGLARREPRSSGVGLAILSLAASLLWTAVLRPAEARTRSLAVFAVEVRNRVGGAQLYVAYNNPEFAWYYGRGVPALPREIANGRPAPGQTIYLVARPNELTRFAPAVRNQLELAIQSRVLGGGGPPALYLLTQADRNDGLNPKAGSAK